MVALEEAIEAFWQARRGGAYPVDWGQKLTQEDAYQVNLALVEHHAAEGQRQSGWKVGLTTQREPYETNSDYPNPCSLSCSKTAAGLVGSKSKSLISRPWLGRTSCA